MWADNETAEDLLGFSVHKDLVRRLVTDAALLPVTVGVFGDWGGGKSSIMKMLQQDLRASAPDVVCLYFNGWMFEGYDDAKAALISSILAQLGEHKRFGPKLRAKVVPLLKQVNLMRVLKLGLRLGPGLATAVGGAAVATGIVDPGTLTALPMIAAGMSLVPLHREAGADDNQSESVPEGGGQAPEDASNEEGEKVDWDGLLDKNPGRPGLLDIRTFRNDFARLLAETDLRALVVLIDDLDRCSPDRLIENLEAIKLFLAVPKTAFVIAADERIVRYAISRRYAADRLRDEQPAHEVPYDLVRDYLEKVIQVPYRLPRLSPSEIESYINLLFCQLHLSNNDRSTNDRFKDVLAHSQAARKRNLYVTYGAGSVRDALQGELPEPLAQQLQWTNSIAPALTEGLKGNPRQVKRFLNALMLRKQLAEVASLGIKDDVLVKLMLLEYSHLDLFDQLFQWQAAADGRPEQIKGLEDRATVVGTESSDARPSATQESPTGALPAWNEKSVQDWLRLDPSLGEVDLRDYFWISRDRLTGAIAGLTMVAPLVRNLFDQLVSSNEGDRGIAAKAAADLDREELAALLRLLTGHLQRQPSDHGGVDGLMALIDKGITGVMDTLVRALGELSPTSVEPNVAFDLQRLATTDPSHREMAFPLLTRWAGTDTRVGRAAKRVLETLLKRSQGGGA